MTKAVLGIIGGSGVYDIPELEDARWETIDGPWGKPSDQLRIGRIGQLPVVFLPRHGRGHRIPPGEINYRANIDALKRAGVTDLLAVSAVGSLKEELPPGMLVILDQFIDRTYKRESSFFGTGCVAHVSMAHPVSPNLHRRLTMAAFHEGITHHNGGTAVVIEGPQFSSLAESNLHRSWGASVVGMTGMPEAKLAREAELSFAAIAMVTDYDCWREEYAAVTVSDVLRVLGENTERMRKLLVRFIRDLPLEHESCEAGGDRSLDTAMITAPQARDPALLAKLDAVAGRVLRASA